MVRLADTGQVKTMNENPYADLLHLPHHQAENRTHLSMDSRAAQFSPYAALVGFENVIAETGRLTEDRPELSDSEKEEMRSNVDGSLITNSKQYANEMATGVIAENYGYTFEDAAVLFKSLGKELYAKSIYQSEIGNFKKEEKILIHHGILGMKWGIRRYQNEDGTLTEAGKRRYGDNSNSGRYPWGDGASSGNSSTDTVRITRSSNAKEAEAKSKHMTNDELRKSAERLELENRYIRAVQSQQGKTFMENVAGKANTVASLMNSTNSILNFTTGQNFAQLISKKSGSDNILSQKVKDLELENKYYNEIAKKNRRMKEPDKYIDWDSVIDEWTEKFTD